MNRISLIAAAGLGLWAAREAQADCKLIVNVDLTASMNEVRSDGRTKCEVSQNWALMTLEGFRMGKDFDPTDPGNFFVDRAEYDANCPDQSQRQAQVWVFHGNTMTPLWNGFLPIEDAYNAMIASGQIVNPDMSPTNSCPGAQTPMAQSMCRVARAFSAAPSPPPTGETWVVKMTTDGEENNSHLVPINGGENRCRLPGDTEQQWRDKVTAEYTARDIMTDSVLWQEGASLLVSSKQPAPKNLEPLAPVHPANAPPSRAGSVGVASDPTFFGALARLTGGTYRLVTLSTPLPPEVTLVDGDSDGVPDFRDSCTSGACANDPDGDQIPGAADLCSASPEDARGPQKTDGCPDTDADGIRNGLDLCPTIAEDGRPPFLTDGCRAGNFTASATPGAAIPNYPARVCSSLTMTARSDSALAKINVSGNFTSRSALRGTLLHNSRTVEAFPIRTLPTGSGNFTITNRPVPGLTGDTQGTWTLCLYDTSSGASDSGTFSSWSVHN